MGTLSATAKAKLDAWLGLASGAGDVTFVWEVKPILLSSSTQTTLYFSTHGYRLVTSDKKSPPRVLLPTELSISVLNEGFGTPRGEGEIDHRPFALGTLQSGAFRVLNPKEKDATGSDQGLYDSLAGPGSLYGWGDAPWKLYIGLKTDAWGDFEELWSGLVAHEPEADLYSVTFETKPALLNLNLKAQTTLFAGSGGLEGGDSLLGKPKPRCYGECKLIRAPLVTPADERYLVDPAGIQAIDESYEGGHPHSDGSVTYRTDTLASGYFDLEATATAEVRADVKGQKFDSGSYSDDQGKIIEQMISDESSAAVDSTSLTAFSAAATSSIGVFLDPLQNWNMRQALEYALAPRGILYPEQDGSELFLKWVTDPSGETAAFTFNESHIKKGGLRVRRGPQPLYRVQMGYAEHVPLQQILVEDPAEIERLAGPRSYNTATDASVKTDYPNALDAFVSTPFADKTEAGTEATAYLNLFKVQRWIFELTLARSFGEAWVGDYVSLDFDRYGLSAGKVVLVTGVRLNLRTREMKLECWG